jgi:hypothetical protein
MTAIVLQLRAWRGRLVSLDRVWLAIGVLVIALGVLAPAQAAATVRFALSNLAAILPFLATAVALAAYAKASGSENLIVQAFRGHPALAVVSAAVMGALAPFCSCGVIPLIAAALAMGVSLPAVMAFWLSSPLMDPSMFMVTMGALGLEFALAKTLAAVGIGLLGGYGVMALERLGLVTAPLRDGVGSGGCAGTRIRNPKAIVWPFWREAGRRAAFAKEAGTVGFFLAKWLTLAYILESLMLAHVPAETFARLLGGDGLDTIVVAALIGMPAYLNGLAALPLVGALMQAGLTPGAGLAFLLAGGVSSIPAATAVFALVRLPVFFAYLGFALIGSIGAGIAYQVYVTM